MAESRSGQVTSGRIRSALAVGWIAYAFTLTLPAFVWHVQQYRSPSERVYSAMLALLPLLFLGPLLYAWLRRRWLVWEPVVLAAIPLLLGLIYEPLGTAVAIALLLSAYGTGAWIPGAPDGGAASICLSLAAGFGILIIVFTAAAALGLLSPAVVGLVLIASLLIGGRRLRGLPSLLGGLRRRWAQDASIGGLLPGISTAFLFLFAILSSLSILAPPRAWDVLRNHIPLARHYAETHRLQPLPGLDYSYYPQGVEVLMGAAWTLAGRPAAQIVPPLFFAAFLLACFALARQWGMTPGVALSAVAATAATPFLLWSGSVPKNDMALAFFVVSSLLCYAIWQQRGNLSALLAGAAMLAVAFHVKHVAFLGLAAMSLLFLHACWKERRPVRAIALLAIVFLCIAPVWMIRTYLAKGNPLFPQSTSAVRQAGSQSHEHGSGGILARYAAVTHGVLFEGKGAFEATGPSENPAGVLLIFFVPLALAAAPSPSGGATRAGWTFAVVYFLFWAYLLSTVRYAIPFAAVLCLLSVGAAARFATTALRHALIAGAFLYSLVFAALSIPLITINAPLLRYFAGKSTADRYLEEILVDYPAIKYVRAHAAPGDKIFGLENGAAAYAPEPKHFYCLMCHFGPCAEKEVLLAISERPYRWLLLSNRKDYAGLFERVERDLGAVRRASTPAFTVFELPSQTAQ